MLLVAPRLVACGLWVSPAGIQGFGQRNSAFRASSKRILPRAPTAAFLVQMRVRTHTPAQEVQREQRTLELAPNFGQHPALLARLVERPLAGS